MAAMNGNQRKHLGREILVKRYGGNPEMNRLIVEWRNYGVPFSQIAKRLFERGLTKKLNTRQAVADIYYKETRA